VEKYQLRISSILGCAQNYKIWMVLGFNFFALFTLQDVRFYLFCTTKYIRPRFAPIIWGWNRMTHVWFQEPTFFDRHKNWYNNLIENSMEFYLMPNFNFLGLMSFLWICHIKIISSILSHIISVKWNEMRGCQTSSKLFYTVIDHIIIYI
jgi:hypothetical protein